MISWHLLLAFIPLTLAVFFVGVLCGIRRTTRTYTEAMNGAIGELLHDEIRRPA